MTTPSGRGKGKTSQVPKVYKIKPEFRNPTNEVIEKVSKDILADIKLDDLPSKYTRDIAQLVKGMALTETMAVSNQAKRTKLPAETAAEKKLIADIKSSSSKLCLKN
jgi:pyrrolidone-carboxylate peptidase